MGDSNEERLQTFQNLLVLRNGLTTALNTSMQVFDNQADDNVSTTDFISGGINYNISVGNDSYIEWESGYYRINPNDRLFGILNVRGEEISSETRTHTPYTVPLDLPTTDNYGKNYYFLNAGKEINFTNYNSTNETGAAFTSTYTKKINDAPLGAVSLAAISWETIYLNLNIARNGISKKAKVLIGQGGVSLKPKCKLKVDGLRTLPINIGFQYSNLIRDYVEGGITVSFLQNLFLKSESDVIITSISNTDLMTNISKNLNTEDLVFNFPSCVPGVEK